MTLIRALGYRKFTVYRHRAVSGQAMPPHKVSVQYPTWAIEIAWVNEAAATQGNIAVFVCTSLGPLDMTKASVP